MMIANILLTFYRVTVRHPRYSVLNLLGLSFGIAVFLTLSLYARFETSYEAWVPGVDTIYQLYTRWTLAGRPDALDNGTMGGLLDQLHEDYPDLAGTRAWSNQVTVHVDKAVYREKEELVDANFFQLFDLPLVAGDKASALSGPDKIVLDEVMAQKYFGHADAVGETIRLSDLQGTHAYTVSAVLKALPRNTDLDFRFLRLLTPESVASQKHWAHWGSTQVATYLRFATQTGADIFASQMPAFIDRKAGNNQPPGGQHVQEALKPIKLTKAHLIDSQSESAVVTLGLVGITAFLIAAINFINLSTARAGIRAREVAVRRTLGATQSALRVQFLSEAVLTTMIASLIGLSIVELTLPAINAAGDLALSLNYSRQWLFLLLLLAGVVVLGFLSGLYPAFVLSSFQPAQVLASSRSPSGGRFGMRLREALVVVQFAVVIAFFILTWGFDSQLEHMKTADIGFQRSRLFVVGSLSDDAVTLAQQQSILAAFRATPGVISVGSGDAAPGNEDMRSFTNMEIPGGDGRDTNLMEIQVGENFFQTYQAKLLAGRVVDRDHPSDDTPLHVEDGGSINIVLSSRAMSVFGFASPQAAIDQNLKMGKKSLHIVGVVGEISFHSQKEQLPAVIFYFSTASRDNQIAAIRYDGVPEPEMRARLGDVWRQIVPDVPLDIVSAEDNLFHYYRPDSNRSHLFSIGAAIAALVGCIGLYGMAAFSTSRRMLEVAVRKVLGASRGAIVGLLVWQFLRPVLLANLIAVPVGYLILANWLQQFNDRIGISAAPFLAAGGTALLVAMVTVSALAFASANARPSRALRHE